MRVCVLTTAFVLVACSVYADSPATTSAAPAMASASTPVAHASPLQTKAEVDQRISDLTKRQFEIIDLLQKQKQKSEMLWMNPQFSSPEINAMRARYEALRKEVADLELKLRAEVADLPAAQAELEKARQAKQEYVSIGKQIEDLQKERAHLP